MSISSVNSELERSSVGLGIRSVKQTIKYSDMTAATTTGTLTLGKSIPAYSMVIGSKCTIKTAFTGGINSTATLVIGTTAGEDDWTAGGSMGSVYTAGTLMKLAETYLEVQTSVAAVIAQITVDSAFSTITAGEMIIEVFYFTTEREFE